jgi:CheY-like chemotaxis protein
MMVTEADILNAGILIVDDQAANVILLERLLRDAGYAGVSSTMNPREVCALHRDQGYDLILLDLQMPGMDGFKVMEDLKANAAQEAPLILVITAQPGHKLRALQAGAKDFISKPYDLVEIKTRIHNLLEVQLLYKKLEHHGKALQRLERVNSELVSALSHELPALLSSIRAALAALASGVVAAQPDQARGVIETAEDNCERLIRLINELQVGHRDS